MSKNKKITAIVDIIFSVILLCIIYLLLRQMDLRAERVAQENTQSSTEQTWAKFPEETTKIRLGRRTYAFSHPVKTYLLIGTDKSGKEEETGDNYQGAMADALMLVVLDEEEESYGILQLNRDTITEVPMLQKDGSSYASADMQLCTAHWYGRDREASCENTVNTVSDMLGGVPIDGYYALQMEAMPLLNSEVGGVTVTLEDDMTKLDPEMKKGAVLTLTDHQAELLLQTRYAMKDDRNTERMRRQRLFLESFMTKAKVLNRRDPDFPIRLYDRLHPYATENININQLVQMFQNVGRYTNKGIFEIKGESEIGEKLKDGKKHWEFYMDEGSLDSTMNALYPLVYQKEK